MASWSGVSVVLEGDSATAMRSLGRVVNVGARARIILSTDNALVIDDRWRPTWTRVLTIAAFPFGLVALAYRRQGQLAAYARPAPRNTTEVTFTGNASRLISRAMWTAIGQSLPAAPRTGDIEHRPSGRIDRVRRTLQDNARPRWVFASTLAVLAFVITSVLTGSAWDVWSDLLGNVAFTLVLVGLVARVLDLWPNNRLIHWHRVRLPDID